MDNSVAVPTASSFFCPPLHCNAICPVYPSQKPRAHAQLLPLFLSHLLVLSPESLLHEFLPRETQLFLPALRGFHPLLETSVKISQPILMPTQPQSDVRVTFKTTILFLPLPGWNTLIVSLSGRIASKLLSTAALEVFTILQRCYLPGVTSSGSSSALSLRPRLKWPESRTCVLPTLCDFTRSQLSVWNALSPLSRS